MLGKEPTLEKRVWKEKSSNGIGQIYNLLYQEENTEKRGIVVILHGMQSHSDRYLWLLRRLAEEGYVACCEDLQGHGRSDNIPGSFGPERGWEMMQQDIHKLICRAKQWFPGLPVILFGHSMGSFLARDYVVSFPEDVDAMILSATGGYSALYRPLKAMLDLRVRLKGATAEAQRESKWMSRYMNRHVPHPENDNAWMCSEFSVTNKRPEDPLMRSFTIGAYRDMLGGVLHVSSMEWARAVKDMPIFLFAGGADPVGEYGKGPAEVYAWLHATGHHDLCLRIYSKKRHEVLNENVREDVVQKMEAWLRRVTER